MEIEVGEVWKDIKGYEGLYQVSNFGRVKSLFRYKKILKLCKSESGYLCVNLYKNKKMKRITVHRLVAENFINKPTLEVNHKDGNKENNFISNLEWVTTKENIIHRFKVLKQKPYRKYTDENIDWNTKQGINKYARLYYQKNKEKILEYGRQWRKRRKQTRYKVEEN